MFVTWFSFFMKKRDLWDTTDLLMILTCTEKVRNRLYRINSVIRGSYPADLKLLMQNQRFF